MTSPAVEYHQLTKHGTAPPDPSRLLRFRPLDPANRPEPFKRYPGREVAPLPADLTPGSLGRLLFLSAGVTRTHASPSYGGRTWFRAAMSAGNLHPIELYVASADGLHHFAPLEFGLTQLRTGDVRPALAAAAAAPEIASAPWAIVVTGIPWRTGWKYGERGYRHLFWDGGTMLANLLAVASADGVAARVLLGFVDDDVARLVGVDGETELPLALVVPGEGLGGEVPPVPVEPLDAEVTPLSPRPLTFPLVVETHRAGTLADARAVAAWRTAAAGLGSPGTADVEPIDDVEQVILRRGSTRVMRREPVPYELLGRGMALASQPLTWDASAPGATLLRHLLSVHAVDETVPGSYRWDDGQLVGGRQGDTREVSQQLCLGQPLGGDSAYTVFHAADLDAIVAALGTRGYRAALLEAGIASGRLALAAFALGHGATGLTFYDDLVSQFFGDPAACMLVTSVGVPDYRSRPGGHPGQAVELTGYGRLMERLSLDLSRRR